MTDLKLLCTDLDRTLLPNGLQPETPGSRQRLWDYLHQQGIKLAYVSGRRLPLVQQAIDEYQLPTPEAIIADVGSSIYQRQQQQWQLQSEWCRRLQRDWRQLSWRELSEMIGPIPGLALQPESCQSQAKLSYFYDSKQDVQRLKNCLQQHLPADIHVTLVDSVDETSGQGLLDLLPTSGDKYQAICWLMQQWYLTPQQVLFAGDSGNDLAVLTSELPGVLVANATATVKQKAIDSKKTFIAHATNQHNGCYSAGILQGIHYFYPSCD